jgi:hypothetical protein
MRARVLNARTPDEVFYDSAIRIPRREPDESFGYLFFDLVSGGRVVGNNGVRHEGRIYRLTSLQKHLEYWGERVDVRVNPDDQRVAMIFDRLTGVYVCKALVDAQDATYDTRDEVTRQLIARVFSDGKHLLRMAKEHVEGAKERLVEYRLAKIEYLTQRYREIEATREQRQHALGGSAPVTVIGPMSAVARERETAQAIELSATVIAEVLKADELAASVAQAIKADAQSQETPLCVVSTRTRKPKVRTGRQRRDGTLRFAEIARRLGTSTKSLERYRQGVNPWPEGMKERFEAYDRLRTAAPSDASAIVLPDEPAPAGPRRTRGDGELSYANIAKTLGMSLKTLDRCRQAKRSWPAGTRERFEDLERRRAAR